MREIPEELALARELHEPLALSQRGHPDIELAVDDHRLGPPRPQWMVVQPSPGIDQVALRIELQNVGSRHAAVSARWIVRSHGLVRPQIIGSADDPDVVAVVRGHGGYALNEPGVRQRHFRPEGRKLDPSCVFGCL